MLEFILEIFSDLLFEGSVEAINNKKVPKIFKFCALIILIIVTVVAMLIAYSLFNTFEFNQYILNYIKYIPVFIGFIILYKLIKNFLDIDIFL